MKSEPVGKWTEDHLTVIEKALVSTGIECIQNALQGELLAIYMQDERGRYLSFRPGNEREIVRSLADIDWPKEQRVVEEHCP